MTPSNDTNPHRLGNDSDDSGKLYVSTVCTPLEDTSGDVMNGSEADDEALGTFRDPARDGLVCPNCGGALEGRKCKLFCQTPGCGYLVTCSEW